MVFSHTVHGEGNGKAGYSDRNFSSCRLLGLRDLAVAVPFRSKKLFENGLAL